jgi:putative transposase
MAAVVEASKRLGAKSACEALGLPRATYYRHRLPKTNYCRKPPPRKLTSTEQAEVLSVLHEPRFADQAAREVYAQLLDEGRYLCSVRSMYRLLAAHGEVRERRKQLRHPKYSAPQLHATAPRQL